MQVAWLLGHGYTSGMSAMDAFLTDDILTPPGSEALFSETLIRLDRIPLAYKPPQGMPNATTPPGGGIVFGYFGRPDRLNARVIQVWSRILTALPEARLMLNSQAFGEAEFRALWLARFAAHGIDADRLAMIYTAPQPRTWDAYGQVDIALDPFPHNAGTTTIEALWQGVPVVTNSDRPSVGRLGASILNAVGLNEFIARDDDEYVEIAVRAARDRPMLNTLRASLRPRMALSPLLDAPGLARALEDAYRTLLDASYFAAAAD